MRGWHSVPDYPWGHANHTPQLQCNRWFKTQVRGEQGAHGNFYGTTIEGGAGGYGIVYKMTSGGTLTTLHSFNLSDGAHPGGLTKYTTGIFYGTTTDGGSGAGTVYKLVP